MVPSEEMQYLLTPGYKYLMGEMRPMPEEIGLSRW